VRTNAGRAFHAKDLAQAAPPDVGEADSAWVRDSSDSPARIFLHAPSFTGPFDIEVDCMAVA
jgi:hypothetical protein